jgi:hypothetical protein
MRLQYNPKNIGNRLQILKGFLTGSLVASSFVYLVLTEYVHVFFAALFLIIFGLLLLLDTIISMKDMIFLSQVVFFFIAGVVVSLFFHAIGFLFLYLGIIVILVIVTWFHRYTVKIKKRIRKPS